MNYPNFKNKNILIFMNFFFIYHHKYFTVINYNIKICKNLYIIKC